MSVLNWRNKITGPKKWDSGDVAKWVFAVCGLCCSLSCWVLAGLSIAWLKGLPAADSHAVKKALFPGVILSLALIIATTLGAGIIVIAVRNSNRLEGWSIFMIIFVPTVNFLCYIFFVGFTTWSPESHLRKLALSQPIPIARLKIINGELLALNALTTVNVFLFSISLWAFAQPRRDRTAVRRPLAAIVNPATVEDGAV